MTPSPQTPSVKQQRDARRAEKVEAMKRKLAVQRRNRTIGIVSAIAGGIAVIAIVVTLVVINPAPITPTGADPAPVADPDSIEIDGLVDFGTLAAAHVGPDPVDYEATYDMNPPAGGDHFAAWLNCGVYEEQQVNENAVHSLEHGAVWITYDPELVDSAGVDELRAAIPTTYSVLSPYPGLPAPVVASAWGKQVQLDGPNDPRLADFIQKFWQSPNAPEPGAPCTGAIDGPGKIG